MHSSLHSGKPGAMPVVGRRASPTVRSPNRGGPGAMGDKRTQSKRSDATYNESNRINAAATHFNTNAIPESVVPLKHSANRSDPSNSTGSRNGAAVHQETPKVVDCEVRSLLNRPTTEKFDTISNQIIASPNKDENEKSGRTIIQVIQPDFEMFTEEAAWSEMYARLCRKMMDVIDEDDASLRQSI